MGVYCVLVGITSHGLFHDWRHRPAVISGRGSPSWRVRNRRCRSDICWPEWRGEYEFLQDVTAFQHACLIGPPEGGVDDGGGVAGQGGPDSYIAHCSGPTTIQYSSGSGEEDAEEGGVGPEGDGVAESCVPVWIAAYLSRWYSMASASFSFWGTFSAM